MRSRIRLCLVFLACAAANVACLAAAAVKITYKSPTDPELKALAGVLKETKIFDELAAGISKEIKLPRDLPVRFEECGEQNAFYDSESRSISMCYEMFALLGEAFSGPDTTDEEVGEGILGAGFFIFLHELGHALVDNLDIPVTGKEEDAVDDLATLILIGGGSEGQSAAMSALLHFAALADAFETGEDDLAFWDEHSLNSQRVYNVACLLYGSDPEAFGDLVGDDGLPEERAARCPAEYSQKSRSWEKLLKPHVR
jgi:Putative metallopeptidase